MSVEADAEPRSGLDPKSLGFVLVTLAAWNVAFVARERFGNFTSVGAVTAVCLVRGLGLSTPWRELLWPRRDALLVSLGATALLVGATALLREPILRAWPWLDFHVRALYLLFG